MKTQTKLYIGTTFTVSFLLWTLLVKTVDVASVGPNGSAVGFSTLNTLFHRVTGVNMTLYTITDWLGLVPVFVALCFALFGLFQLIKRKSLLKVDFSILALGVFYIAVIGVFVFFEFLPINYRPVLIDGYLEASYPSSTTLLTATVMPTAAIQLQRRIKRKSLRVSSLIAICSFSAFMIIGRFISGVHWLSDIIGGLLVSAFLVLTYRFITDGKA